VAQEVDVKIQRFPNYY